MSEILVTLGHVPASPAVLALLLFLLTVTLVTLGIPGVLIPLSLASGALLGSWLGLVVVISGSVFGSQVLFLCARKFMQKSLRDKWGRKLAGFAREVDRRGFGHIVALRVVGAPHFLVTTASALSPVKGNLFAAATLVGLLPVVALTTSAGAALS